MTERKEVTQEEQAKAVKLAGEHWNWLSLLLQHLFIDAMVHGYRHGVKDGKAVRTRISKKR